MHFLSIDPGRCSQLRRACGVSCVLCVSGASLVRTCVHACMPQLRLRALRARRGRGHVEKQDGRNPSEKQH